MRKVLALALVCAPLVLVAQTSKSRPRTAPPNARSAQQAMAESAVQQAMQQLAADKKTYDRDLAVLVHLRAADDALTDPMQPNNAIQKALDEVNAASLLPPEFLVGQGVVKVKRELEQARLSPVTADFGRLRAGLRSDALAPAIRLVARNASRLQDETLAWMRVQELIGAHLRALTEVSAESARAVLQ